MHPGERALPATQACDDGDACEESDDAGSGSGGCGVDGWVDGAVGLLERVGWVETWYSIGAEVLSVGERL